MLNTIPHGAPTAEPPLLIVHGLFGSARNWSVIAKRLSDVRQVITVDMRNHGQSPWAPSQSYEDMAGDLAEVLEDVGPADVLGHSMGGKAAMVLALTRPELVTRLIVADIAPVNRVGIYMGIATIPWFLAKTLTGLYSGVMLDIFVPAAGPQSPQTLWLIYGVTAAGACALLGSERICPCARDG